MVNGRLGFTPVGGRSQRYSTVIGRSPRNWPSVSPVTVSRPPKRKLRLPGRVEPRHRRQVGRYLVERDPAAAQRIEFDPARDLDAQRAARFAVHETVPTVARGPTPVTIPSAAFDPSGRTVAAPVPDPGKDQSVEIESGLDTSAGHRRRRCRRASVWRVGRRGGIEQRGRRQSRPQFRWRRTQSSMARTGPCRRDLATNRLRQG